MATHGKKARREAERVKPVGTDGLERIRQIVTEHQFAKVNEVCVDAFTAQHIIALHDNLNPKNQAKLLSMPVARVADFAFKLLT